MSSDSNARIPAESKLSKKAALERFLLWEHSYPSTLQNFVYNITPDRFPERDRSFARSDSTPS